jgi:DNA invertase Pin-like site-specific DNA recombinase
MTVEAARPSFRRIRYEDEEEILSEVDAASLARHSTDNQLSSSCDDQLRRIQRSVDRDELRSLAFPKAKIHLKHQYKDEAISGFGVIGRDGLDAVLSLIRQRKVQLVLVDDFKRLIRSMGGAMAIYDLLQEYGAELLAVSDGFSSSEKGARLKFMNKAYASEEFLESVSLDTQRGLNERRWEGFSDGHLWFGIGSRPTRQIPVKGKLKDSYFEYYIIPEQADLVVRIFKMANDGFSQKEIARVLNSERVPPPSCYDKSGKLRGDLIIIPEWRDRTIFQILNNRSYIGILERGKTRQIKKGDGTKQTLNVPRSKWLVFERHDLRIVQQDLWDSLHKRYEEQQKLKAAVAPNRPFRHDGTCNHVFTSLCKCDGCGGPFVVISGKGDGYYGCTNAHRAKTCDNRKTIAAKKLDLPILRWVVHQLQNEEACRLLAEKYNQLRRVNARGTSSELEKKETELVEVKQSIKNLLALAECGSGSQNLAKRLGELDAVEKSLEAKVKFFQGADSSEVYMTAIAIRQRLAEVPDLLQSASPFEVNRALKPLFSGAKGLQLARRAKKDGTEGYWAVGNFNLGRALGLVSRNPDGVSLDLPLELEL